MRLLDAYAEFGRLVGYLKSLSLLFARLVIAYGFYKPSEIKWADPDAVAVWFASLQIPFPLASTYLVSTVETAGVVFLTLGLFTRIVSVPLIVVMIVAIMTVHLNYGFSAAEGGFEIPLYYMLFLFLFVAFGPGRYSLDHLLFAKGA